MTISSTTSRWAYTGDGGTLIFPYTNKIFNSSDLQVYVDSVLKTEGSDYTVSGVGDDGGGSVTFLSAPGDTLAVVIVRDVPNTQPIDFPAGGPFPSEQVESGLDRATIQVQQLRDTVDNRTLALDPGDPAISIDRLPLKSALASMFLAFDADGNPIASTGPVGEVAASAFGETLVGSADAAAARTTLELGTLATADGVSDIPENLTLSGVLSPAQLTASQNNYNPTGLSTATVLRLSTDASRNITGLAGGAAGRIIVITNVGSNDIVLVDSSGSSSAANQFQLDDDITLGADQSAVLQYDGTSSRWRALSQPAPATGWTYSDSAASTSGTSIDFTGIPSGVTEIVVTFVGVSQNAANTVLALQIGDAGGLENSDYIGQTTTLLGGTGPFVNTALTSTFLLSDATNYDAAVSVHGTLVLRHLGSNTWSISGQLDDDAVVSWRPAGIKTLSGTLDRLSVITTAGTATFDAGTIYVNAR
jgi:hypothetical protein